MYVNTRLSLYIYSIISIHVCGLHHNNSIMINSIIKYYRTHVFLIKVDGGFLFVLLFFIYYSRVFNGNNSNNNNNINSFSSTSFKSNNTFQLLLPKEFTTLNDISKKSSPALFKKCAYAANIPAMMKWNPESITSMIPTLQDVISLPTKSFYYIDNNNKDINCYKQRKNNTNFNRCRTDKDYENIDKMKTETFWQGCKDGKYFWHSSSLRDNQDIYSEKLLKPMKKFIIPDNLSSINSWFGCKGITTELHYDMSHNIFIQIWGRKKVTLINTGSIKEMPSFTRKDYIHPSLETILNVYRNNNEINVTLDPGDVLYIPPLVYHRVEVLDENAISLNIWSRSNEDLAFHTINYDIPLPFEEQWMDNFNTRIYVTIEYIRILLENDLVDSALNGMKPWFNNRWNHSIETIVSNVKRGDLNRNNNNVNKKQPTLWAIRLVNNNNHDANGMVLEKFVLAKRFKDKFSTRSKSIISNITNLVQDKTKQRVILWNYIDQMITFSITLGHGSNNFDDSNGNDGNGLSAFDQLLDIISAVFV